MSEDENRFAVELVFEDSDGAVLSVVARDGRAFLGISEPGEEAAVFELSPTDLINVGNAIRGLGRRMQGNS